jgi:hypothetical protein
MIEFGYDRLIDLLKNAALKLEEVNYWIHHFFSSNREHKRERKKEKPKKHS